MEKHSILVGAQLDATPLHSDHMANVTQDAGAAFIYIEGLPCLYCLNSFLNQH